jgi:hypothetical protein
LNWSAPVLGRSNVPSPTILAKIKRLAALEVAAPEDGRAPKQRRTQIHEEIILRLGAFNLFSCALLGW